MKLFFRLYLFQVRIFFIVFIYSFVLTRFPVSISRVILLIPLISLFRIFQFILLIGCSPETLTNTYLIDKLRIRMNFFQPRQKAMERAKFEISIALSLISADTTCRGQEGTRFQPAECPT